MEMTEKRNGSMVGGTAVEIGRVTCEAGLVYVAVLQYGGLTPGHGGASKVDGKWVPNIPVPDARPTVTLSPHAGGRRDTYLAHTIVESARGGRGFLIPDPFDGPGDIRVSADEITRLAWSIEQAMPKATGNFEVRWVPNEFPDSPF